MVKLFFNEQEFLRFDIKYSNITTPKGIPEMAFHLWLCENNKTPIYNRLFVPYLQYTNLNITLQELIDNLYTEIGNYFNPENLTNNIFLNHPINVNITNFANANEGKTIKYEFE